MRLCSKCGVEPAKPGQSYGKKCHAEYMQGNRKGTQARAAMRNAALGAEDFRGKAVMTFERIADREMNGRTAAEIVRNLS